MTNSKKQSYLRQQAENKLDQEELEKKLAQVDDLEQVIEELKIHQIELELQNQDLKVTRGELQQAKERYYSLYDLSPVAYFTFDPEGIILEINNTAAELLAEQRNFILNKPVMIYLPPQAQENFYHHRQKVLNTREQQSCELEMRTKEDKKLLVRMESKVLNLNEDEQTKMFSAVIDMTARKERETKIKKLSQAVEQSPATVVITDADGSIEYVNPKFTELTGYSLEEVKGEDPSILRTELLSDEFYEELWDTISAGEKWRGEFHNQKKNGEYYWEFASISPLLNEEGKITHYVKVGEDTTERKELEEELKLKNKAVESSINAIAIADLDGQIIYINQSFTEMWGYSREEIIGYKVSDFWHDAEEVDHMKKIMLEKGSLIDEVVGVKKDCSKIHVQVSLNIVYEEGTAIYQMASFVDITKRKKSEEKLADYAEELEKANDKIENELAKAQEIHQQFLPSELPQLEYLDFAAHYHPTENLGGDFYNVLEVDNYLIFYLADITGHGLEGAMLNIFVRETVNSFLISEYKKGENLTPERLMNFITTRYQKESFPEDYFLCLLLGIFDKQTKKFKLSNAGIHIPPLIQRNQGVMESLTEMTLPISPVISKDNYYFSNKQFDLNSGDLLFLSTDGLIEENREENKYGLQRIKEIIAENNLLSAKQLKKKINDNFNDFIEAVPFDDITFLIIKYDN
ncbi:PAS domain S-box protein [Halanaerobacter jeridensis]|uniref:PAS domain S-box-containing protein n=1 Tax=Halanaerobacter jeridensis TaxID=706427 RepID=A0A938XQV3_9FIRM|nr:PAS domain S-box protein [Halanaerobacter jeridensis]MBM7555715.1 PAS domain S-box-containing protein [Halanaerobacter jeridensis]